MTTRKPTLKRLKTENLLLELAYQTHPGVHTYMPGCYGCGGTTRGYSFCRRCIDAELLRRGINAAKVRYRRDAKRGLVQEPDTMARARANTRRLTGREVL